MLHEMAHAATTEDHDQVWLTEIRRLQALGEPVDPCELKPAPPPRGGPAQLKLWLYTVWTWEEVFGLRPYTPRSVQKDRQLKSTR